jgi:hypothetical protein
MTAVRRSRGCEAPMIRHVPGSAWKLLAVLWAIGCLLPLARGGEIVIDVPDGPVRSALAENRAMKLETDGIVDGRTVRFAGLLPDTPYDIEITLRDGTVLAGFDAAWYEESPAPETRDNPEPLSDDDRREIGQIVSRIPSFYDRCELLHLIGSHDRAVGLVQLVRDRAFHASAQGEIIWRVELYYFRFQAGGWEKVQQQNRVLRRDRFASHEQYEDVVGPLRWTPLLGGVRVGKDQSRTIALPPMAGAARRRK